MELEFELLEEEIDRYRRVILPPLQRRSVAALRLILALVPGMVIGSMVATPWSVVACIGVVVLMMISGMTNRPVPNTKRLRLQWRLAPEGIESQVTDIWHRYAWSQVGEPRLAEGLILVPLGHASHLIVPERVFATASLRGQFLERLDLGRKSRRTELPPLNLLERWQQPPVFEIAYRNRLEDYLRMQHPGLAGGADVGCLLWLVLVSCLGLTAMLAGEPLLIDFGASVLALAAMFVSLHFMQGPMARWYSRLRADRDEFEQPRTLSMGPLGLALVDSRTQVVMNWGAVGAPQWMRRHLVLLWSSRGYLDLVPISRFKDFSQAEPFVRAIQEWRKDWREQHAADGQFAESGNPYQSPLDSGTTGAE